MRTTCRAKAGNINLAGSRSEARQRCTVRERVRPRSVGKFQITHDRLEARLFAQRVHERISLERRQEWVTQA